MSDNSYFQHHIDQLILLHRLIAAGEGDGEAADALRDKMDASWRGMTESERRLAQVLSEDLYLHQDRLSAGEATDPSSDEVGRFLRESLALYESGEHLNALELLRRFQFRVEPEKAAHFRSLVWEDMNAEGAARFYAGEAVRLCPAEPGYKRRLTSLLIDQGRIDEACGFLQALPPDEMRRNANLLFESGRIHHLRAKRLGTPEARPEYDAAFRDLTAALLKVGEEPSAVEMPARLAALCHMELADCHAELGDFDAAGRAYDAMIELEPKAHRPYVLRGLFNSERDPEGALRDFSEAIRLGTDSPVPYYHLAYEDLRAQRYQECRSHCHEALARLRMNVAGASGMRADLFEWIAISLINLRAPDEEVRLHLQMACQLSPTEPSLKRNLQVFEKASRARWGQVEPDNFQISDVADVRERARAGESRPKLRPKNLLIAA